MNIKKFIWRQKRRIRFAYQRITRGWDDSDTWSLDHTIAKEMLPRLKRFKELNDGPPHGTTSEQWDRYLDRMIAALELYTERCYNMYDFTTKDWATLSRGKKLIFKYYRDLWW